MMFNFARHARGLLSVLVAVSVLIACGCSHRSARDYIKAGDQAMHDNQVGNAQEDYEAAVKLAPDDAQTHLKLGDFYMFEHNYPAAEVEYTKVATIKPLNAQTHAALAKLYTARAQWSSAENQMRAAVVLDPVSADYRRQLAAILNQRNQVGQAEIELRTAVGLSPGDAHLHLALAKFLSTLPSQRAAADEEYARVRQLDPSLLAPASAPAEPSTAPPAAVAAPPPGPSGPAPASAPPPSAPAMAAAPPSAKPMKALNRKFRLTHNSPVYQNPDANSSVLGQVHRRKYVHVTGITGEWLQVTLRNGTVGFIPVGAAE
ncbi:MAG TPA: SH3 domain-containing protein [Candidatus Binataceae bacterium]